MTIKTDRLEHISQACETALRRIDDGVYGYPDNTSTEGPDGTDRLYLSTELQQSPVEPLGDSKT